MTDRTHTSIRSRPISIGGSSTSVHPSEGLCSPPGLAHTPPGVVTKLKVFHSQKIIWRDFVKVSETIGKNPPQLFKLLTRSSNHSFRMTGERLVCLCCTKKNQCFCKKCTLEKLKFYSRKENISIRLNRKAELEKEINALLGQAASLHAEINTTTANITLLRKWVEEKKQLNQLKTDRLTLIKQLIASTAKHANKVLSYYEKHDANELTMQKRKNYKEAKVNEMNGKLFLLRKSICGSLFSVFPVSEVIAHSVRPDDNNDGIIANTSAKWTMLGGQQFEEGPMVKVRDNFLSDAARERLGPALAESVLNLSTDLRSPFAAFLLSIQLVNNIAAVFDFRLPYLLLHHEMCLRERWSRELLDNDWFKFCQSVLSLCLHLGMPPESLHFNCPHSNIIEQARFIMEGVVVPKPHPVIIASSHRFEIDESLPRMNVADKELISEWDICEDLDL